MLTLEISDGEFVRTSGNGVAVQQVKGIVLKNVKLTNCNYRENLSSYGRDGKMLFENTLVIEPSKDVNGDGAINVGDVNYVLNLILNEAYEKKADVNVDDAVNVGDVNAILAYLLANTD